MLFNYTTSRLKIGSRGGEVRKRLAEGGARWDDAGTAMDGWDGMGCNETHGKFQMNDEKLGKLWRYRTRVGICREL